ncbi:PREDICTED: DNA (cytosine-5)-methyltransferase 1-like [Nelumbo nucifera]|uniref:DNA (cytosine-5-)-methyltransferase n=1 Tax=Nelumbo nucifera TaxID=4432 RepID=A0A1U7Z813_NELNU|nr:PREDICTED: DNA (cytosine-5)-methyltransferase 1-like [Nelumbo nucifera]
MADKILRRSPRSCISHPQGKACITPSLNVAATATSDEKCVTSSPGIFSASMGTECRSSKDNSVLFPDSTEKRPPVTENGKRRMAPSLKTAEGTMPDEKLVRRSPRISSASLGTKNNNISDNSLEFIDFAKKRLSSAPEIGKSHLVLSPKTDDLTNPDEKCVRRSQRMSLASKASDNSSSKGNPLDFLDSAEKRPTLLENGKNRMTASLETDEQILLDEKYVRRSPRISLDSNKSLEFLDSAQKRPSVYHNCSRMSPYLKTADQTSPNERCVRRSPRISLALMGTENILSKGDSFELANSSQKGNDKEYVVSTDQAMLGEKCIKRFPRTSLASTVTENNHSNCSSLEFEDSAEKPPPKKLKAAFSKNKSKESDTVSFFIGEPVPADEARQRWPWRYEEKGRGSKRSLMSNNDEEDEIILNVKCHYTQAEIDKCIFNLGDCAYVKGKEGAQNYVGRILEFFKTMEGGDYFRVQWFFRAEDTVMKDEATFHDKKRLFYSDLMNDNLLDCIVSKVKIVQMAPSVDLKPRYMPPCDLYYDMKYSVDYSTFTTILDDVSAESSGLSSSGFPKIFKKNDTMPYLDKRLDYGPETSELALLDLYSGCGGMSTGLCLGAKLSGVNLVTRWAVDFNVHACESLRLNHPETQIRNETAEDFLDLLKEWEKLCKRYVVRDTERTRRSCSRASKTKVGSQCESDIQPGEYEVLKLVDICYGDPGETGNRALRFKVRWKGYHPSDDTWEPIEHLGNCQDRLVEFVREGCKSKILPLPGDVDVICGGPPCQGISGYNRHRNVDAPLDDEKNRQIVVFMDIVEFLKPKYVLMENVVDILRFAKGSLGRYALSRLVHMNYQARLGTMAAGCYGLPQFRLRVFLWGAHPNVKLPQYPLPTHDVILRYGSPNEFERNVVAYDEGQPRKLEKALCLHDALSDLPVVTNDETREEMSYRKPPETEFQKYIRSTICEMMGSMCNGERQTKSVLYDHRPLPLNEDDYARVCQIPQRKGANFRDLPGLIVGADNVVQLDPSMERILLPSGKPLVPDYALRYAQGKSVRPFARLWWDETVPTVLTTIDPRFQATLHPEQDRVLTIRECARLQGFPDYYRFYGTIKQRYIVVFFFSFFQLSSFGTFAIASLQ